MYSKIKLFRTLSSHLLALIVFGLSAQALHVSFYNPLQGSDGVGVGSVGERIAAANAGGYQYSNAYGWTPNVIFKPSASNMKIYKNWDVDDGTGGSVRHNGALYKSGTSSAFVFDIIADPNYEVSLRELEVALYNSTFEDTEDLNYKIIYSNDGTTFNNIVLDNTRSWSSVQNATTNANNADNTIDWASGTYRARAIRVEFDLTSLSNGLRPNFGITGLGFEQHAVPEPSVYALILGGLALGWVALKRRIS